MSIAHLFNVFIIASFAGWIYESLYCTIKSTRWQNRGFLFGPVCPIYGVGFLGGLALYYAGLSPESAGASPGWPAVFLICAAGSAVLEYATSFALEKIFHARWWDYSHVPLNLNGRICLPATLGFGCAGVIVIRFVLPAILSMVSKAGPGPGIFAEELISLVFMWIFAADMALSISSITSLMHTLEKIEAGFDTRMEASYAPIGKTQRAVAGKIAGAGHAVKDKIGDGLERMGGYKDSLVENARSLTGRQINVLMNMEAFSSKKREGIAARLKEFVLRRDTAAGQDKPASAPDEDGPGSKGEQTDD